MRRLLPTVLVAVSVVLTGCETETGEASLFIAPSPRTIDALGQTSTITVTATDDNGKPGTGNVQLTSTAGSLKDGIEISLAGGTGTVDFACDSRLDANCKGTVRINGSWNGVTSLASLTVQAAPGDAGTQMDAGTRLDGGVTDGGMSGDFALALSSSKTTLIAGATDSSTVLVRFFTNTTGMVAVSDTVNLTLTGGASFSATAPQASSTVMTDASGVANVTIYVGAATGPFSLEASARDAAQRIDFLALNVRSITHQPDPQTSLTLNVSSTGTGFSTPVLFRVIDNNGLPLQNVEVQMSLAANAAAGSSVAPTLERTNAQGIVTTTLRAGDASGLATVNAAVSGLPSASSPQFAIVIGRPSDKRLQVTCTRLTLGAMQSPQPPRVDQGTRCAANFADRDGKRPNFDVRVAWLTEAGQINPTSTGFANTGVATVDFTTSTNLPALTTPLAGEPFNGTDNPRDRFVTVVASMEGEESFWDGTGSSNGVTNGKWDPGEYFVDLGEPFVDSNDNGQWDPGEEFSDTERTDCATGASLGLNRVWDGPNGCWDKQTIIWGSTIIVYSGHLNGGTPNSTFVTVTPPFPTLVAANSGESLHNVAMTDNFFNALSSDNIGSFITRSGGLRGGAVVAMQPVNGEPNFGGHDVSFDVVEATEVTPGNFVENGLCDSSGTDAGYPLTRCVKRTNFTGWRTKPTTTRVAIQSAPPQLPPGPPTNVSFELRVGNNLGTPPTVPFSIDFE